MPNNLKAAVIGVGNMGRNHARIYSEIPRVDLCAVSDINEKSAKNISKEYNVKYYSDFRNLLKKEKPNLVSVCVPTSQHYNIANICLREKTHTLLEKPITLNLLEGEKLIKTASQKKVKLLVGHIERFNPAVIKVKDIIKKGSLGKIVAIIARRVGGFPPQIKDANIAVDLAIHDIDIVNFLLDMLPQKIIVNKQKNHIRRREDSVEFFLQYKKTSAYIQANWITPVKIRKLNITGTEGYLEMDYISQKIDFYKSNFKKFREFTGNFSDYILRFSEADIKNIEVPKKEPLRQEIEYFINCINSKMPISSNFSLQALKIALT